MRFIGSLAGCNKYLEVFTRIVLEGILEQKESNEILDSKILRIFGLQTCGLQLLNVFKC